MRPYEVMAIFEATTEPTVIQGVLDRALEVIRATGGNPGAIDRWGRRPFAYEVNHQPRGLLRRRGVHGEPETVAALDRMLTLADEVVRHKVVRLPDCQPPVRQRPSRPRAERAARGADMAQTTA